MLFNEFCQHLFRPQTDEQQILFEQFRQIRSYHGIPHKVTILRHLARTRPHTRTVYPPGWRVS